MWKALALAGARRPPTKAWRPRRAFGSSGLQGPPPITEATAFMREKAACERPVNVAVVGASSRAGWTAAFLLKSSRLLSEVRLHDWQARASITCPGTRALAAEMGHISTACVVSAHAGSRELQSALTGADVVLLCADTSPESSEEAALNRACSTAREVAMAAAAFCPEAVLVVSAEPVNSLVPLVAEVLEHAGVLDCGRVLGVASVDAVRAAGLLAKYAGLPAHRMRVPVVGGRSATTAVPVLSQARPSSYFTSVDWLELRERMVDQEARPFADVGRGSAAARTVLAVARGLRGEAVQDTVFVRSDLVPGARFLTTAVELGARGVVRVLPVPPLAAEEEAALVAALAAVAAAVEVGECYARQRTPSYS